MPGLRNNNNLPVAHPREVHAKVERFKQQLDREFRSAAVEPATKAGIPGPVPCGYDEDRREVRPTESPDVNPYLQPWYVDHSPYMFTSHSWATAKSIAEAVAALQKITDRLKRSGWRIAAFKQDSKGLWELAAEAPGGGYGASARAPIPGPGSEQRVVFTVSSSCFRHPDAHPAGGPASSPG